MNREIAIFPKHTESVERSRWRSLREANNAVLGKAEQSQDVSFFIELTIYRRSTETAE
jgi:hypothetical protein